MQAQRGRRPWCSRTTPLGRARPESLSRPAAPRPNVLAIPPSPPRPARDPSCTERVHLVHLVTVPGGAPRRCITDCGATPTVGRSTLNVFASATANGSQATQAIPAAMASAFQPRPTGQREYQWENDDPPGFGGDCHTQREAQHDVTPSSHGPQRPHHGGQREDVVEMRVDRGHRHPGPHEHQTPEQDGHMPKREITVTDRRPRTLRRLLQYEDQ